MAASADPNYFRELWATQQSQTLQSAADRTSSIPSSAASSSSSGSSPFPTAGSYPVRPVAPAMFLAFPSGETKYPQTVEETFRTKTWPEIVRAFFTIFAGTSETTIRDIMKTAPKSERDVGLGAAMKQPIIVSDIRVGSGRSIRTVNPFAFWNMLQSGNELEYATFAQNINSLLASTWYSDDKTRRAVLVVFLDMLFFIFTWNEVVVYERKRFGRDTAGNAYLDQYSTYFNVTDADKRAAEAPLPTPERRNAQDKILANSTHQRISYALQTARANFTVLVDDFMAVATPASGFLTYWQNMFTLLATYFSHTTSAMVKTYAIEGNLFVGKREDIVTASVIPNVKLIKGARAPTLINTAKVEDATYTQLVALIGNIIGKTQKLEDKLRIGVLLLELYENDKYDIMTKLVYPLANVPKLTLTIIRNRLIAFVRDAFSNRDSTGSYYPSAANYNSNNSIAQGSKFYTCSDDDAVFIFDQTTAIMAQKKISSALEEQIE